MLETLLHFEQIEEDITLPLSLDDKDGLNYSACCSLKEGNATSTSKDGVALAHEEGNMPVLKLILPKLDAPTILAI